MIERNCEWVNGEYHLTAAPTIPSTLHHKTREEDSVQADGYGRVQEAALPAWTVDVVRKQPADCKLPLGFRKRCDIGWRRELNEPRRRRLKKSWLIRG